MIKRHFGNSIAETIGLIVSVIILAAIAFAASWGLTCLFVYWISLLWAGTIFAFDWSWEFATGIWLALALLSSFCSAASIKRNNQ